MSNKKNGVDDVAKAFERAEAAVAHADAARAVVGVSADDDDGALYAALKKQQHLCLRRHPYLPELTPMSAPPFDLPEAGSRAWDGDCVAVYVRITGSKMSRRRLGIGQPMLREDAIEIISQSVREWSPALPDGSRRPMVLTGRGMVDAEAAGGGINAYLGVLPLRLTTNDNKSAWDAWSAARKLAEWMLTDQRGAASSAAARLGRMAEKLEARVEEAVSGLSTKERALVRSRVDGAGAKTDGGEPQARSTAASQPTVAANRHPIESVRFVVDGRRHIVLERPEIEAIRRLSVAAAVARVMDIHWRIGLAASAAVLSRYAKLSKSEDEIAIAVNGVAAFARGEISRDAVVDDLANLCRHGDVTQCCRVFEAALSLLSGAALVTDGASTVGHGRLRRYAVEAMQGIAVAKSGADRFYVCDSIGKIVVDDMIRDARIELGAELAAVIEEMNGARLGTASNASDGEAKK